MLVMRIFRSAMSLATAATNSAPVSQKKNPRLAAKICMLVLPVLLALNSNGQVATSYSWSTSTGTYTAMAAAQTVAYAPNNTDVAAYAVITLPFTFTYNGTAYTQVTASVDGWLAMGSLPGTVNNTPAQLFTNATPTDAIGPWWGDGGPNFASGGRFYANTTGTDIYTVQWDRMPGSSTGGNSSSNQMSYQVSLYGPSSSSPGKIEILYGPKTATPSANRAIGIKSVTGGVVSFINGVSGSTSSTASNNAFPASGTMYIFTPSNTCATPANPATGFLASNATSTTLDISFTAATGTPSGYVVVRTPFGTSATNPVDATTYAVGNGLGGYIESVGPSTSFTSSALTASTQYTYTVFAYNNTACLGGPKYLTASTLIGNGTTTATPGCATPANAATGFTVGTTTGNSLAISFTAASGSPTGYLAVRTPFGSSPTSPVDGTTYTVGSGLGGYIELVGAGTSFTSSSLSAGTQYTYTIYSYNANCVGAPAYQTATTLVGNGTTSACTAYGTPGFQQFTVGPSGDWTSIGAALAAITTCNGISGPIVLELKAAYVSSVETFPLSLSALTGASATNTITIRPETGATNLSLTSSNATGTVLLNASKFYILDGRAGGSGTAKQLTISNTGAGYALQFINDASTNTVKYCTIKSNNVTAASGTIVFSTTTGSTGNDNNMIDNNDIGDATNTLIPVAAIYSLGSTTTTATYNGSVIISNNNIFNFFAAGSASNGMNILAGNNDWTITGNSFYQTVTRTATGGATHSAITFNNSTSAGTITITNNYFGGTAAQCGGGNWTLAGSVSNRWRALNMTLPNTPVASIQGNTIAKLAITSTNVSATGGGPFVGIYLGSGSANIGGTTGNVIGGATGTGSITITSSGTAATAGPCGILSDGGSSNSVISNNIIGSITVAGVAAATNTTNFFAIATNGGTAYTISGNTIGSTVTANSIQASTAATAATGQTISGIYCVPSSTTLTISGNTISNIDNAYLPSTAASVPLIRGIYVSNGKPAISGNTVTNLTGAGAATGTGVNASILGIVNSSTTAGAWSITQNTVSNLTSSNASSANVVTGIYNASSATFGTVGRNIVYNLSSSSNTGTANGIEAAGGSVSYQNNMIRLGVSSAAGQIFNGITESASTANYFYHNTVYIGGTAASGAGNSFALSSTITTGTRDIRNNILTNARVNGASTGKHYAIRVGGTSANPAGLTMDNNVYSGGSNTFGFFNGADVTTLAAWRTATGKDANSVSGTPCFSDATNATTPNLHLTNCSGTGNIADAMGASSLNVAVTLTDDYDGQTRASASLTPVDAGADAGNFGQLNDAAITVLTQPTATSCHSATENVVVTLFNNYSNTITFGTNNVTITTQVTGAVTATLTKVLNASYPQTTLAPGASMSVIVGQLNTTSNGTYSLQTTVAIANDQSAANDVLSSSVVINYSPLAVSVSAGSSLFCGPNSTIISSTPSGGTLPYSYAWSNTATTQNIVTGTIGTTTTYSLIVTDNCSVTANGSATVTVLPALTASIDAVDNLLCNSGSSTNILITSGPANGSVTYTTNGSNPQSISLNGSGAASFSTGSLTSNATYTITSVDNGSCATAVSIGTTVYVGAIIPDPMPNSVYCAGTVVGAQNFGGNFPPGTQFSWTNTNTAIGLAASGTGASLPGFTAVNGGNTPVYASLRVTPIVNPGSGCKVSSITFRLTVMPLPAMNGVGNQQVCTGVTTQPVSFTSNITGTTFTWTNSNTAIGLVAMGATSVPAFVAQNNTATPSISATITVTPRSEHCSGTPITYTYQVNKGVSSLSYAGSPFCQRGPAYPQLVGVAGGTYTAVPAGLNLNASTGQINLALSQAGNYTVTYTAAPGGGCGGAASAAVVVLPVATVNPVGNPVYCAGATTAAINFTGTGSGYTWTNSNTSIGLAASGSGNIGAFTATNATNTVQSGLITVTPQSTPGTSCTGVSIVFKISVNPTPSVTSIANQVYCRGVATSAVSFAGPVAGTSFNWTSNSTITGLTATRGIGTINSFTTQNPTLGTVTSTITVTPIASKCPGSATSFQYIVNDCIAGIGDTGGDDATSRTAAITVSASPNPAQNRVTISVDNKHEGSYILSIIGQYGQQMKAPVAFTGTSYTLDLTGITPGIYTVQLVNTRTNVQVQRKLVKF
jgi:hypothetical protein